MITISLLFLYPLSITKEKRDTMRRLICVVGLVVSLSSMQQLHASENLITESEGYTLSEASWVSRDGGESKKLSAGDKIEYVGDYYVMDKVSNTLNKISIQDTETMSVRTVQELKEEVYQGLRRHETKIVIPLDGEFTTGDVKTCISSLIYEYPLIDYLGASMILKSDELTLNVRYRLDSEEYRDATTSVVGELDALITTLDFAREDVELELELVRWLRDRATYYKGGKNVPSESLSHNVQNLAFGNELVCDGYSKTLMYLLNSIGIPTEIVLGTGSNGAHAWNIVKLGEEYYHVDVTWSDSELVTDSDYVDYFNEKDNYMEKTHTWERTIYPKCVGNTYYNLKNFKFVSKTLEDFTPNHSILVDSGNETEVLKKLSRKLDKRLSYYSYKKYGKVIITLGGNRG